jgi:hypothetical protein
MKKEHLCLVSFTLCFVILSLFLPGITNAAPEQRTALVIGNSAYSSGPLKNPVIGFTGTGCSSSPPPGRRRTISSCRARPGTVMRFPPRIPQAMNRNSPCRSVLLHPELPWVIDKVSQGAMGTVSRTVTRIEKKRGQAVNA